MPKIHIYTLAEKGKGEVRYVGQTVNLFGRLYGHKLHRMSATNAKAAWVDSVISAGGDIEIRSVEQCFPDEASEREAYWINHYRRLGCKLTNSPGATTYTKLADHRVLKIDPNEEPRVYRLISRAPTQTSISTVGSMRPILVAALEIFPEALTPGEAYKMALLDWCRNRKQNAFVNEKDEVEALKTLEDNLLIQSKLLLRTLGEIRNISTFLAKRGEVNDQYQIQLVTRSLGEILQLGLNQIKDQGETEQEDDSTSVGS